MVTKIKMRSQKNAAPKKPKLTEAQQKKIAQLEKQLTAVRGKISVAKNKYDKATSALNNAEDALDLLEEQESDLKDHIEELLNEYNEPSKPLQPGDIVRYIGNDKVAGNFYLVTKIETQSCMHLAGGQMSVHPTNFTFVRKATPQELLNALAGNYNFKGN